MKTPTAWQVFIYGVFAERADGSLSCIYIGQSSIPDKRKGAHLPYGSTGRVFKTLAVTDSDHASALERDFILAYKAIGEAAKNIAIPSGKPLQAHHIAETKRIWMKDAKRMIERGEIVRV